MKSKNMVSFITVIVACMSLFLSFYIYWETMPSQYLEKKRENQMNILTSQALVLWQQIQIVTAANRQSIEPDPYLFVYLKDNCKRVESSIENAIGLGLWDLFVPKDIKHSMALHVEFMQSLTYNSTITTNITDDWTKEHFLMGMIRLLEFCKKYDKLNVELKESFNDLIDEDLRKMAWNYLEKGT